MIDFGALTYEETKAVVQQAPAAIKQEVKTTPVGSTAAIYLAKVAAQWTWNDLRDYVITEVEKRFGPQVRDPRKEASIFKSFISRHGIEDAVLVAQAAFKVYDGRWANAPITVNRFCKESDAFFAERILGRVKG